MSISENEQALRDRLHESIVRVQMEVEEWAAKEGHLKPGQSLIIETRWYVINNVRIAGTSPKDITEQELGLDAKTAVTELRLSVRALKGLSRVLAKPHEEMTLDDIIHIDPNKLRKTNGIGPAALCQIFRIIAKSQRASTENMEAWRRVLPFDTQ